MGKRWWSTNKVLISLTCLVFWVALGGNVGATPISSCTTITSPGYYYLTQDIINSAASICINITSSDVVFDGQGYTIDGQDTSSTYGVYVYNPTIALTNVTIKNLIVTDWNNGIYYNASNGSIDNNSVSSNTQWGIILDSSSFNTITNNKANSNGYDGILLDTSSNNNTLTNNNASSNTWYGIYLDTSSEYNILDKNIASSNGHDGIRLTFSSYNILTSNTANSNNDYGIFLGDSSSNTIYNNRFNNTNNFYLFSTSNDWNTTKTSGTNIIGGPYIGGNFWAYPNGTGFSQTCTDADSDGICDSSYTLASGNVDYLPLSLNFTVDFNLTNPEAHGPYNVGDYVNVTWEIIGTSNPPNFINIEYYDETNSTFLELVSYSFSPTRESDNSHQVGVGEAGHIIRVYIYFADDATDLHGDSGTRNEISDTYTVYTVPEFPFGFGIMIIILAGLYFKMRRWKLGYFSKGGRDSRENLYNPIKAEIYIYWSYNVILQLVRMQ